MASWLAFAATAILSISIGFAQRASNVSPEGIRVLGGNGGGPAQLVFACDGSTSELESLFSQPGVISDLRDLNAGIALALPDLSPDRARIVRQLNSAGIPVTAWLALPVEQGYYLNAGNAPEAAARFAAFRTWTSTYGLRWAGVGLDIEPNIQDFATLRTSKWRLAWTLADARRVRSTLLERLAGIVDVRDDREVLMIYTSFNQRLDSALIWVHGPDAQAIAVGSTSGPEAAPRFTPLH